MIMKFLFCHHHHFQQVRSNVPGHSNLKLELALDFYATLDFGLTCYSGAPPFTYLRYLIFHKCFFIPVKKKNGIHLPMLKK